MDFSVVRVVVLDSRFEDDDDWLVRREFKSRVDILASCGTRGGLPNLRPREPLNLRRQHQWISLT